MPNWIWFGRNDALLLYADAWGYEGNSWASYLFQCTPRKFQANGGMFSGQPASLAQCESDVASDNIPWVSSYQNWKCVAQLSSDGKMVCGYSLTHAGYEGNSWASYDSPCINVDLAISPGKSRGNGGACGCGNGSDSDDSGASDGADNPIMVGDPINIATGNAFRQDTDFSGGKWLTFRRFYNGAPEMTSGLIGVNWRHSFDRSLLLDNPLTNIKLLRPDGRIYNFIKTGGVWSGDQDVPDTLVEQDDANGNVTGFIVWIGGEREIETYSSDGKLLSISDSSGAGVSLTYSTADTPLAVAPYAGLLLTVTDKKGRGLGFSYNSYGYVTRITLPDAQALNYGYDSNNNLSSVTYPDAAVRTYVYNESGLTGGANLAHALTGIVDESKTRFESTSYIGSGEYLGYATASGLAGNVGATVVTYAGDQTSEIQYATGATNTITFGAVQGVDKVTSTSQSCGPRCGQVYASRTYDANGYPATVTDWSGNVTSTSFDLDGLLTQRIEGVGTSGQRTTNTTWDSVLREPLLRSVYDAQGSIVSKTGWVYNSRGQDLARCEIDPAVAGDYVCSASGTPPTGVRRWAYTYCDAVDGAQCPLVGLLLSVDGPRTDVADSMTYRYYLSTDESGCGALGGACHRAGDLYQVTNALGQSTAYVAYDKDGRVVRLKDANGVLTDFTYTPRGWLLTRTLRSSADGTPSAGDAVTTLGYKPYGAVSSVTDPDGVSTTYSYDDAHRLTDITDALGNHIHYTLDAAGNKTAEQVFDTSGKVTRSTSRGFNALGQLTSVVDGLNHTVFQANLSDSYDGNGNLVHSIDGLGIERKQGYDALNRLVSTIDNYNGTDAATHDTLTQVSYDALDRTTRVTDPDNLVTSYTYDGLGNLLQLHSPDTGVSGGTGGDLHDAAGNLTQHTDARGVVTLYQYDALDRLTQVSYPAHPALNVTFHYDESSPISGCPANFNVGHLTSMTDASGSSAWCYTNQGDVREVRQVINNTVYLHGYA